MGFSPKARRYVKAGAKITKATASISARKAETKRTQARYGYKTPELATKARKAGALSYESATQGRRVAKAAGTRLGKSIARASRNGERIPYDPLGKRQGKRGRMIELKPGDAERYEDLRARRLRGEWFDNIVEFVWLMDMAQHFSDADARRLRASPDARSPGGEDEDYEE